jgi:neutral ceramidase
MLEAGEGVVDITPPLGIELAGFHKPLGQERVITGLRSACEARALVLRLKETQLAVLSLDVCGFPREFVARVQRNVSKRTGIPEQNVRVCATHTHSAPTLRFFRQWGAVSSSYSGLVEQRATEAVALAKTDLAEADCYLGKERVVGGNFNRAAKTWKTDEVFGKASDANERWLDTMLHCLYFQRDASKRSLLWYHFSAHPVCYTDGKAGPDWPGLVAEKIKARDQLSPSFLQGHCGDVNPGDGKPWLGDAEKVSDSVYSALHHATNHSESIRIDEIKLADGEAELPFDIALLQEELAQYRQNPAKCNEGEWVDARFAEDWFKGLSKWNLKEGSYRAPISAIRLGELGVLFHPAELYSYYGLAIRRDAPFPNTIVVGYADDFVGYLPDPKAFEAKEYAAMVVPKILDLPPFKPEAASRLTSAGIDLLKKVA